MNSKWMLIKTDTDLNVSTATVEANNYSSALECVSDAEFKEANNKSSILTFIALYPDNLQIIEVYDE
tara:strand:- start:510 stop:710 length:201 start_codon:yes stop_codon:yes gene_type:complete